MAQNVRIRDKDRGYKRLLRRLRDSTGRRVVNVGIMGKEAAAPRDGGVTNVQVATFHEFGIGVPERSFIRAGVDENRRQIAVLQTRLAKGVVQGKLTQTKALEILGLDVRGKMQRKIESNIPPRLKQATIDRKGSSVALIDTGQLVNSITFEVGAPR